MIVTIANILLRLSELVDWSVRKFMATAMGIIVLLVMAEVVARNLWGSLIWVEEVAVTYLGTWLVFIGASHAMRVGFLTKLDFVVARLNARAAEAAFLVAQIAIMTFLVVIIIYGIQLSMRTMSQPSPALRLPMGMAYLGIVVGCSLMALHTVTALVEWAIRRSRS